MERSPGRRRILLGAGGHPGEEPVSPKGRATWLSQSFWSWEPGQSTHQRQAAPCKWVGQPVLPGSSLLGAIFFQASSSQALPLKTPGAETQVPVLPPPLPDSPHPTSSAGVSNPRHTFLPVRLFLSIPQTSDLFPQAVTVTLPPHLAGYIPGSPEIAR